MPDSFSTNLFMANFILFKSCLSFGRSCAVDTQLAGVRHVEHMSLLNWLDDSLPPSADITHGASSQLASLGPQWAVALGILKNLHKKLLFVSGEYKLSYSLN